MDIDGFGVGLNISIHAPLAGRDPNAKRQETARTGFQSTRPLRGATLSLGLDSELVEISIHAPLAGRDYLHQISFEDASYFNPRAPCGARPGRP